MHKQMLVSSIMQHTADMACYMSCVKGRACPLAGAQPKYDIQLENSQHYFGVQHYFEIQWHSSTPTYGRLQWQLLVFLVRFLGASGMLTQPHAWAPAVGEDAGLRP